MADGFIWGDAQVTYPDFSGNAQLDMRMTGRSINEVVGLSDEWLVIGLDMGGGEIRHELQVIVVHKDAMPAGGDALPRMAENSDGEIHATTFLIHDVDPYEVLRAITHVFEMRLRVRGCRDFPIRIMSQADVPEQPL
jgi:hypothetical protein